MMGGGDVAGGSPGEASGGAGGGGGGRRGGRRPRGMMGQLADEAVQAELKLTDEQKSKIEELAENSGFDFSALQGMSAEERTAFFTERRQKTEADIKGILEAEQFARVQQLTLRATGMMRAIGQSDVQADLKLTDDQKKLIAEYNDARGELGFRASAEEREKFNEEWNPKISAALTDEQKEAWEKLLGAPPAEAESTDAEAETADENKE